MNVFGYGSLMWDGWDTEFGCTNKQVATLPGFTRDFNKASTRNWGSPEAPEPTLGLHTSGNGDCQGMLFEFPDDRRDAVMAELRKREGPSFELEVKELTLADGTVASAVVPINNPSRDTFIGDKPVDERARMAREARGQSGACADYIRNIRDKLLDLDIQDPVVEEFAQRVSEGQN